MGKFLESKKREWAFTEQKLGKGVICDQCGATLDTFAEDCDAELDDPCPGFKAIEEVKAEFYRRAG